MSLRTEIDSLKNLPSSIKAYLDRQGTERPESERWNSESFYNEFPEQKYYETYRPETVQAIKEVYKSVALAKAKCLILEDFLTGVISDEEFCINMKNL